MKCLHHFVELCWIKPWVQDIKQRKILSQVIFTRQLQPSEKHVEEIFVHFFPVRYGFFNVGQHLTLKILQTCIHGRRRVVKWQRNCPSCPFTRRATRAEGLFHNKIIGNFIFNQDRLKQIIAVIRLLSKFWTVYYNFCYYFEVNIVAEQKQA